LEFLLDIIQKIFPTIVNYKYTFLFLGGALEGLNTMVVAGFLVSIKALKIMPTFIALTIGYTVNGYLWYLVGYIGGIEIIDRWVRSGEKSRKIIDKVQAYFEKYSGQAIVITKFTFALTIATLIMAGSLKYDLKKFSRYNFIGSIGWVILTMSIGFFFGESYKFFLPYLQSISFLIIFLASAILVVYITKVIIESAFIKALLASETIKNISDKIKTGLDRVFIPENGNKKGGDK
jgi:membrane-associated protein